MRITQYTDYALRVLLYLGADPQRRATIAEIAERYAISRSHLMKVVNQLIAEGYVSGVRGKGGGITLGRDASAIVIGDVVRHIERDMALVECQSGSDACIVTPVCRLRHVLDDALAAFVAVLDGYTLADMVGNGAPLRRVLGLQQVIRLSDETG